MNNNSNIATATVGMYGLLSVSAITNELQAILSLLLVLVSLGIACYNAYTVISKAIREHRAIKKEEAQEIVNDLQNIINKGETKHE